MKDVSGIHTPTAMNPWLPETISYPRSFSITALQGGNRSETKFLTANTAMDDATNFNQMILARLKRLLKEKPSTYILSSIPKDYEKRLRSSST